MIAGTKHGMNSVVIFTEYSTDTENKTNEKADGEKLRPLFRFGMRKFDRDSRFLCGLCAVNSGNAACFFASFAAFYRVDGSGAVKAAPDSGSGGQKGNSAEDENFRVGDASEIACAGNAEKRDDTGSCHDFKNCIQNICSFHFTTSFPDVYMGCVR